MPDRVEREIEEILAKMDDEPGRGRAPSKEPIPLRPRNRPRTTSARMSSTFGVPRITPATLLFGGAGIMIVGLLGATFADGMIWLSFAGVVLFLAAFVWSLTRRPIAGRGGSTTTPRGTHWRDRYVEYDAGQPNGIERFKRVFRKK
jgi:hypothetical protein